MMRQFTTLEAPVELVRAVYLDLERWPEWRPGIRRIEILERGADRTRAVLSQRIGSRYHDLTMDFEFHPNGFHEHQRRGLLKKWIADWTFQPAPSGAGTVISMSVDLDVGLMGLVVSQRRIHRRVERLFRETAECAARRIRASATTLDETAVAEPGLARRIRIRRTVAGLEVWLDDRRYVALPAD